MKCLGQFSAHAERNLRAGPHGQLAVAPLRQRGPWLERAVGDIGDGVRGFEFVIGGGQALVDIPLLLVAAAAKASPAATLCRVLLQVFVKLLGGQLRRRLPLGLDGCQSTLGQLLVRRRHTDEVFFVHHGDARHGGGIARIERHQRRVECVRSQDLAHEHAWPLHVRLPRFSHP